MTPSSHYYFDTIFLFTHSLEIHKHIYDFLCSLFHPQDILSKLYFIFSHECKFVVHIVLGWPLFTPSHWFCCLTGQLRTSASGLLLFFCCKSFFSFWLLLVFIILWFYHNGSGCGFCFANNTWQVFFFMFLVSQSLSLSVLSLPIFLGLSFWK